jgi:hypothetical protein
MAGPGDEAAPMVRPDSVQLDQLQLISSRETTEHINAYGERLWLGPGVATSPSILPRYKTGIQQ